MRAHRRLLVVASLVALIATGTGSAQAQFGVSGSGATPPASLAAYRGMAAWVDIFDTTAWSAPESTVDEMHAQGVKTLFLEVSHTGVTSAERPLIKRFLSQAHLDGMRVVAWYLPQLTDPATEYQQALTAITYEQSGQSFDGFALDIESTVDPPAQRTAHLLTLSRMLRNYVGPMYALGAIIPAPKAMADRPDYWPGFPYRQLASLDNVFLPMGYYTYHTDTYDEAKAYTLANVRIIRQQTGRPSMPIHPIGGVMNNSSLAQLRGFVDAVNQLSPPGSGLLGTSVYKWSLTTPAQWQVLAGVHVAGRLPVQPRTTPTIAQMIGQKLVVAMDGTTPSASLLDRIRTGQVGGVILFHRNFVDATHLRAITGKLKAAAAAGNRPHLLIAIDQEGGEVKQVPWAPPSLTPGQMGRSGQASIALQQGQSTGTALHNLGITTDLAPVADVPISTASFMYQEHRTWSFRADVTSRLSTAFAEGLDSRGTTATMKHFPGLGYATKNTDYNVVHITATKTQLAPGLLPYRNAIGHGLPIIMLSNAGYSAYDRYNAAGWSSTIVNTLLRGQLGFHGVTITDSLDGTAHARRLTTSSLAIRAARAGTDMILSTGSEAATRAVYTSLVTAARNGQITQSRLLASYNRILTLKSRLG